MLSVLFKQSLTFQQFKSCKYSYGNVVFWIDSFMHNSILNYGKGSIYTDLKARQCKALYAENETTSIGYCLSL